MSPANTPAITDADLARLLGAGDRVPAMPAGLADRIMAAVPAAITVPPLPPITAPRRRKLHGQTGRWLRGGVAVVAGLGLATAVAAGLARTPLFAPLLAPAMERLAEVTGLPALAPRPQPRAVPAPAATPVLPPAAAPQARITTSLPAPVLQEPASLPAPPLVEAPRAMQPERVQLPDRSARDRRPPAAARAEPQRSEIPRTAIDRPLADRPIAERAAIERVAAERPLAERLPPERPLAERLQTERPLRERPTADGLPLPDAVTEQLSARAAAPMVPDGPVRDEVAAVADAARPEAAAVTAEIKALREARSAGTLTGAQAQRLRALQQLRAARAARAAIPRNRR
jgi:hypothetical protein